MYDNLAKVIMNKIYIIADTHGSSYPIENFLNRINDYDNSDTLIILGDAGLNYYLNKKDAKLKEKLSNFKINFFLLRGNHEQRPSILAGEKPDKWHLEEYFSGLVWVENDYPYIKYAMDYVNGYRIGGYRAICFPGAYSVDKYHRLKMKWSWFPQEQLTKKEMSDGIDLLNSINWECDLVLSHTCPIIFEPTDLFLSSVDQSMVDKTMERYLGSIEYNLQYKLWCFGHFHDTRIYPKSNISQMLMLFNDKVVELSEWMTGDIGQFH